MFNRSSLKLAMRLQKMCMYVHVCRKPAKVGEVYNPGLPSVCVHCLGHIFSATDKARPRSLNTWLLNFAGVSFKRDIFMF